MTRRQIGNERIYRVAALVGSRISELSALSRMSSSRSWINVIVLSRKC